jgi:hypothetical protein
MAAYHFLFLILTIFALHPTFVQSLNTASSSHMLRPRLAKANTAAELDNLFDGLKNATSVYAALLSKPKTQSQTNGQNKTSSTHDAARSLVKHAQAVVGSYNTYIRANPPVNDDLDLIQALSGPTAHYRDLIADKAMRNAAAMVAEADVALMPPSDSYVVAAPFTTPPGHDNSTINKRATTAFWMETIGPQYHGTDPFVNDPYYTVFRNVKDYGAVGNGTVDDTDAINSAIAAGNRCGANCGTTSVKPAVIYFPPGQSDYMRATEL